MPSSIKKLSNNFSPEPSLRALGTGLYLQYLAAGFVSIPSVLRNKHIRSVDRLVGRHAKIFYRDGRKFAYDCGYADKTLATVQADNYAFGIAREIYIRDCYFKYLPAGIIETAKTVVDIGSNRGAFSCMMTTVANRIVAVEALPEFAEVTRHNLRLNGFSNFAVEAVFLGEGGEEFNPSLPQISMDELLVRQNLEHIDLMKMDIEGAEYSLFAKPKWLQRVRAITMEVHHWGGDPSTIAACLKSHGFDVRMADEDLTLVPDATRANFIYAWRQDQLKT